MSKIAVIETLNIGCGGNERYPFTDLGCTVNCDVQKPTRGIENFILCDAYALPFRNKAFQKLYAYHLIEHLLKPNTFLQECARITEGKIYIVTPNLYSRNSYRDPSHVQHFSRTTLETLLRKHFDKIELKSIGGTWVHIIESRYTLRTRTLISRFIASRLPFMVDNLYAICSASA
jgi:hypothetical protein